jgi:hypothetical protein
MARFMHEVVHMKPTETGITWTPSRYPVVFVDLMARGNLDNEGVQAPTIEVPS